MSELKRGLKSRHITMIALGGSIGTGVFVASGSAIHNAGPGGAVFAFAVIGLMIYFLMTSLGEMAALEPTTGTFCDYCTRFVSPAFGFTMSYNYWFNWAITVAADLSAAGMVMQYWYPNVPIVYWCVGFFFLIILINVLTVRLYGEVEYWLSSIKVAAVIIFIVVGLLMIFGHHSDANIKNWTMGDGPFHQGWLGILGVMLVAGFSFQGTEIFGVTAGEAENPKKSIPNALKSIFWRIILFYILSMTVIGFMIPYTDASLLNTKSDISLSPFTIVFKEAGFEYAAMIMNAVILTAVLSAANASMYTSTRTLWYMAKTGIAPKIFSKLNRRNVPAAALFLTSLFGAITFLSSIMGSGEIFLWLINISSLSGFVAWLGIAIAHLRFRKTYLNQGNQLADLPYKSKLFPIGPWFTILLCGFIIIGQPLTYETITWQTLISTYISIPILLVLYFGYKFYAHKKSFPIKKSGFYFSTLCSESRAVNVID